ncbi:hypothetical protein MTR_8g469210 [Medicago truncatula]|uniref:Uncharacterized protein n=1 Tax=Medicago truncatula TaxID=3880 RepID=A0A072TRL5_MEDTR|nr:hypothetical protein MTR_8g469210 [Medicago truncatula]
MWSLKRTGERPESMQCEIICDLVVDFGLAEILRDLVFGLRPCRDPWWSGYG